MGLWSCYANCHVSFSILRYKRIADVLGKQVIYLPLLPGHTLPWDVAMDISGMKQGCVNLLDGIQLVQVVTRLLSSKVSCCPAMMVGTRADIIDPAPVQTCHAMIETRKFSLSVNDIDLTNSFSDTYSVHSPSSSMIYGTIG